MRWLWMVGTVTLLAALGPAGQAAAEDQNPYVVINQLELAGYQVNLDRIGSAPIEECVVTEVRNPQQVTQPVTVVDKDGHHGDFDVDTFDVVVHQSISVTLDCTG
jgi:hypothetical protein